MQGFSFSQGLLAALAVALLVAAFTDLRRRQIDNGLNAAIALGAPLFWWASGFGWAQVSWQIGLAAVSFAVLAVLFALRAMGGGDVKLLTALALWIKPLWFMQLLIIMAVAGGVLTLGFAAWYLFRGQRHRLAVPYGVAIATGGLWVLAANYLPHTAPIAHGG